MISLLVVIAVVVAVLGFYRGWFHVESDKTGGKANVTLTVDKNKIQDDKQAAREKAHDIAKHP